jgi:hypothetical protein
MDLSDETKVNSRRGQAFDIDQKGKADSRTLRTIPIHPGSFVIAPWLCCSSQIAGNLHFQLLLLPETKSRIVWKSF